MLTSVLWFSAEWYHSSHTLTALELEFMERWVSLVTWGMSVVMLLTYAGYTLKDFLNLIRSSKCERPHTHEDKIINRFAPIVCGVLRCDEDSTTHTNRCSTRVRTVNALKISGDLRINVLQDTPYKHSTSWSSLSALQMLLCCAMTVFVMLTSSVSSLSDWILFSFTWWCPDRTRVCPLGSPQTSGFLIRDRAASDVLPERIQSLLTHLTPQENLMR